MTNSSSAEPAEMTNRDAGVLLGHHRQRVRLSVRSGRQHCGAVGAITRSHSGQQPAAVIACEIYRPILPIRGSALDASSSMNTATRRSPSSRRGLRTTGAFE